jgi:transposase
MVTIGADCHKKTHTLVAVDPVGRKIAEVTVSNRLTSYTQVLTWAQQLDAQRVWGIENSGSFGRGLAQYLVGQDERVYEVSPHLTGRKRRTSFDRDKSDPTDALAIGRVVLQEGEHLPQRHPEDLSSILRVVVEHRDNLVEERTRLLNQLHMHLVHVEPTYKERLGAVKVRRTLQACQSYPFPSNDPVAQMRGQIIRQLAMLILSLTETIEQLEAEQIEPLVEQANTTLLSIQGISYLTAAKLIAHIGPIGTVKSAASLARYSGIAPVQRSSGSSQRHRVNGGGDRQLQAVFYLIALVQKRCNPFAQAYLAKKCQEGKTQKEAIRCLMRRLVDIVYAVWKHNQPYHPPVEKSTTAPKKT